jgi:hypothetical protein
MTSGSKSSMVFRPVLKSSRPPSACIRSLHGGRGVGSQVGSWRGCLKRPFPWWCHLPSRSDEVDGLASPYTGLRLIAVYWGIGPDHEVPPSLVATVPVERRKLPGESLSAGGFVHFWYLFMKYRGVNGSLPHGAYSLARS